MLVVSSSFFSRFLLSTVVLVANKWEKSLLNRRRVSEEEGKEYARKYGALYAECASCPELRSEALRVLDLSCRFVLFDMTKKESFVSIPICPPLSHLDLSSQVRERLASQAALALDNGQKNNASSSSRSVSLEDSSNNNNNKTPSKTVLQMFQRAAAKRQTSSLVSAVQARDASLVRSTLSASKLTPLDQTRSTAMMACFAQWETAVVDLEIATMLLESCAREDLEVLNAAGETPLMVLLKKQQMARETQIQLLNLALKKNPNLGICNAGTSNLFHIASDRGIAELFEVVSELPDAAFALNESQETPLYIAAKTGCASIVRILANDRRVVRNLKCTTQEYTALHICIMMKHLACVKAIVESPQKEFVNAVKNALNKEGYSPLYVAMETDARETEEKAALLAVGADPRVGKWHRLAQPMIRSSFVRSFVACALRDRVVSLDLSNTQLDMIPLPVFQMKWLKKLNLSRCQLEVISRQIIELSELSDLILSDNMIRVVPLDLLSLSKLKVLQLDGNPKLSADVAPLLLNKINLGPSLDVSGLGLGDNVSADLVALCTHLEELAINDNHMTKVAFIEQVGLTQLKNLWIHNNQISTVFDLSVLPSLELLKVSGNKMTSVSFMASGARLHKLREVWLERNEISVLDLGSLAAVTSLKRLWLDSNGMVKIQDAQEVRPLSLHSLSLNKNQVSELPPSFAPSLVNLTRLWLDSNLLSYLPQNFSMLANLVTLSLNDNPFRRFPSQISSLTSLTELLMNECLIDDIDPGIGNLLSLKKFSLRNNRLRSLPQTIGRLTNLVSLDLTGNLELTSPPPETVKSGTQAIVGFLHDLLVDSRPSYRMKLMIVGQEAVGKSSLLRSIMKKKKGTTVSVFGTKRGNKNLSTDGIDIEQWDRKIKMHRGEVVKVNFRAWDFAGQEVYYSTHSFFLSNRSIYMVVWSMLADEDQQRVPYWLQSIQSRAPKAPVLLVGTYCENMDPAYVQDYGIRVTDKLKSKFRNLSIIGFTPFSSATGFNLKTLLERLDSATVMQPFMGEPLPTMYLALEDAVFAERRRVPPVMSWDEYSKLGTSCGLLREDELLRASSLLHEMGSLFFFRPEKGSVKNVLVVLDPQWLTKMMSQIITTKKSFVKNGVLEHKDLGFIWKAPEYPSSLHGQLLQLLQSFDVCYRMDAGADIMAGRSLIPVLLPAFSGSMESLPRAGPEVFGRIFEFDFLPAGFFGRLTVRLLYLAVSKNIWSDVVVVCKGKATALVTVKGISISVEISAPAMVQDSLDLLRIVVQNIENLADDWFQIRSSTKIPCVHCMTKNSNKAPHLFDLQECEQAAASGETYVSCGGQYPVALASLCPDVVVSADLPVIPWDSLHNQERIGEGTFAYVYRATIALDKVVAVKRLKDDGDFRELRKEASSLLSLRHKNVVGLLGICFKPAALVTEFMGRGSLYEYLQDKERIPMIGWEQRLRFAKDIASGMNFLHTTTPAVLHRDLKSANILLNDNLDAKISDFGTVTMVAPFTMGCVVTNPRWLAPEVLQGKTYGAPSDVYSFGIILWELCTRLVPFTDKAVYAWAHNVEDDVIKGERPTLNKDMPSELTKIMCRCWDHDSSVRPTFEQVLQMLDVAVVPHEEDEDDRNLRDAL